MKRQLILPFFKFIYIFSYLFYCQIKPIYGQKIKSENEVAFAYCDGNLKNFLIDSRNGDIIWQNYTQDRSQIIETSEGLLFQVSGNELYSRDGDFLSVYNLINGKLISKVQCSNCFNREVKPIIWKDRVIVIGKNVYSYGIDKNGLILNDKPRPLLKRESYIFNDIKLFDNDIFFTNDNFIALYNLEQDTLKWQTKIYNDFNNKVICQDKNNIILTSNKFIYSINKLNGVINWQYENAILKNRTRIRYDEFLQTYLNKELLYINNENKIDIVNVNTGIKVDSIEIKKNIYKIYGDEGSLFVASIDSNENYKLNKSILTKINLLTKKIEYSIVIGRYPITDFCKYDQNIAIVEYNKFIIINKNTGKIITKRVKEESINGLKSLKFKILPTNYEWSTIEISKKILDKNTKKYYEISKIPSFDIYYVDKKRKLQQIEMKDFSRADEGIFDFKYPRGISNFILQTNSIETMLDEPLKIVSFNIKIKFKALPYKATKINFNPLIHPASSPVPELEIIKK